MVSGIRDAISSGLIKTVLSGGKTASTSQSLAKALSGGGSSAITVSSDSLRVGAGVFARSVQQINAVIGATQLSEKALEEMGEVTDRLIGLAKRLASGSGSRGLLGKVRKEIKNLTEIAERVSDVQDQDILTTEGLTEIFGLVGLNPDSAKSLARVFDKFKLFDPSTRLAETDASGKPYKIPVGAFGTPSTTTTTVEQDLNRLTTATNDVINGEVTYVGTSYNTVDNVVGNNPLYVSVVNETDDLVTALPPGLAAGVTQLATDEVSGYSLVVSNGDHLGFNGGGYNQVYGVDNEGNFVQQYTNFGANYTINFADVTSDSLNVVVKYIAGANNIVDHINVATLNSNPAAATVTNVVTGGGAAAYQNVTISDDGSHVAYNIFGAIYLADTATWTADAYLNFNNGVTDVGFIENNQLAILRNNGVDQDIQTYVYGSNNLVNAVTGVTATAFATLEDNGGGSGYFAFADNTGNTVELYDDGGNLIHSEGTGTGLGDGVTDLSLAYNGSGDVDIGMTAIFAAYDANTELYRIADTGSSYSISQISNSSIQNGKIATNANVYNAMDNVLNLNPAQNSLIVENIGTVTTALPAGLTASVNLLNVNEENNFGLIISNQDFLGYNAGGYNQVFLYDSANRIVGQITNFGANYTISAGDLSDDNKSFLITYDNGANSYAEYVNTTNIGENPAGSTRNVVETAATGVIGGAKMNDQGTYFAYHTTLMGTTNVRLLDSATFTPASFAGTANGYDFIDDDTLVVDRGNQTINTYVYGSGFGTALVTGLTSGTTKLTASQVGENGSTDGFFAYVNSATGDVEIRNDNASDNLLATYDVQGGDTIGNLNIIVGADGLPTLGAHATINSFDSQYELYELDLYEQVTTTGGNGLSRHLLGLTGIETSRVPYLTRRPEAYAFLEDLEALRDQIDTNLETIKESIDYLGSNLELVRGLGTKFLELANSNLSSLKDAEDLAGKLRSSIVANPEVAKVASNLNALVSRALLSSED